MARALANDASDAPLSVTMTARHPPLLRATDTWHEHSATPAAGSTSSAIDPSGHLLRRAVGIGTRSPPRASTVALFALGFPDPLALRTPDAPLSATSVASASRQRPKGFRSGESNSHVGRAVRQVFEPTSHGICLQDCDNPESLREPVRIEVKKDLLESSGQRRPVWLGQRLSEPGLKPLQHGCLRAF
jgi:hypothetical protein